MLHIKKENNSCIFSGSGVVSFLLHTSSVFVDRWCYRQAGAATPLGLSSYNTNTFTGCIVCIPSLVFTFA